MGKYNKNIIDDNEVMTMTVCFMVGIGVLELPNVLARETKQDAWVAAFIGIIYPLVVSFAAIYLCKYYPEDSILILSKKYLGSIIGTICNFLFMLFFMIYIISGILGLTNIFRLYATPFLTTLKIQIVIIVLIIYTCSKGLKVIAKLNEFLFYVTCVLMLSLSIALLKGNILNIQPVFGAGLKNILKASMDSAYSYGGIEQILLMYPYMKNKNKLKPLVIKATFITAIFYTWVTFISIYYLGYKLVGINLWPIFLVTESITIPLINSIKPIYLLAWTGIMCTVLTNEYFALLEILSSILKVKKKRLIYIITVPVLLYIFTLIPNQVYRKALLGVIVPKITTYNFIYIGTIVLFVFFDKNKAHSNK